MAAIAKKRDDESGNVVTTGSSTAYAITTSQGLTPLVDGYTVTARIHTASGASPTLNVDATGAIAIRAVLATALPTGALPSGGIFTFTYDSSDNGWIVQGRFADSFNGTSAPDLAAIEALTGTGIPKRTGSDTWAMGAGVTDLAATTANRLFGTDGSGVSGVITVSTPLTLSAGALSVDAASDTVAGKIEIAVQSEMETPASSTLAVTPARQHFHPGHPKAGGNFNGQGTPAFVSGDYGMGSITDNGTGDYTLALDTAFSNTNYWFTGTSRGGSTNGGRLVVSPWESDTKTTSAFEMRVGNVNDGAAGDSAEVGVSFWGDYA